MSALRITVIAYSLTLVTAASALAGHPLISDDAGTVEVGKFEIELNGSYTYDKERAAGITSKNSTTDAEVKLTTGLYQDVAVSLTVPYTVNGRTRENGVLIGNDDGFGDMSLEIKYAFAELGGINLAIKPGLTLPTGKDRLSDEHLQYAATLIASKEFAEGKYALHANLGYEYHTYKSDADAGRRSLWSASLAGEAEIVKGLFAVANVGLATNPDKAHEQPPTYALAGVRYEINDNLDAGAAIKFGLTKPEDDVSIIYGLVLKF